MSAVALGVVAVWAALVVLGLLAQAVRLLRRQPPSASPIIIGLPPRPRGNPNMRRGRRTSTHG